MPDTETALSTETIQAIREAQRLQQVAAELRGVLGFGESPLRKFERASPEEFATRLAEFLGLRSLPMSVASDEALRRRIRAVEDAGAIVLRMSMPLAQVLAFALPGSVPAIVLNSKHAPNGQSFSLLHEITHLLLDEDALCLPGESESRPDSDIEVFCNAVAGAALVPLEQLVTHHLLRTGEPITKEDIAALARGFGASRHVVLRRLLTADLISKGRYEQEVADLGAPSPRKGGGGRWLGTFLNRTGETVSRLVIEAVNRELISPADGAQYLNTRIDYLPQIENQLARRFVL